jgi:hypothetical protein
VSLMARNVMLAIEGVARWGQGNPRRQLAHLAHGAGSRGAELIALCRAGACLAARREPCLWPDFGLYPSRSCSHPMVTSVEVIDMTRIEGEIAIGRPAEAVFDYVADQSNEPQYNPQMVRDEKITPGLSGRGPGSAQRSRRGDVPRRC